MGSPIDANVGYRTKVYRGYTADGTFTLTRPNDTDTYTAGDVISAVTTNDHFKFGFASNDQSKRTGRSSPGTLTINAARLWSSANQALKLEAELWLFHTDIVEVADNAAFAPTDAEMLTLIGIIDFPALYWRAGTATAGANGNAVCETRNIDLPVECRSGRIYGQLVVRNAYIPVASEIFVVDLVTTLD
jgi:hypothetical protein